MNNANEVETVVEQTTTDAVDAKGRKLGYSMQVQRRVCNTPYMGICFKGEATTTWGTVEGVVYFDVLVHKTANAQPWGPCPNGAAFHTAEEALAWGRKELARKTAKLQKEAAKNVAA